MEIIFEYQNVKRSDRLEAIASKKLFKISEKYPFLIRAYVFFNAEDTVLDEKFKCGIQLSAPGPLIYASSKRATVLASLNDSVKIIKNKLHKKKRLDKKGDKVFKSVYYFS